MARPLPTPSPQGGSVYNCSTVVEKGRTAIGDPRGGLQPVVGSAPSAGKVSSTTVPFPGAERMRASPPLWRTKP